MNNIVNDFNYSRLISKRAEPLWISYIKNKLKDLLKDIYSIEEDKDAQRDKIGDIVAILDYKECPKLRIELKTRSAKYYPYYFKDNKICLETNGNIELNRPGSCVEGCKADVWIYGFLVGDKLLGINAYWSKDLTLWMKMNKHRYPHWYSVNEYYNTEFILVNKIQLQPFLCKALM